MQNAGALGGWLAPLMAPVTLFLSSLLDRPLSIPIGPVLIIAVFAVGAVVGFTLAASGRLPGTRIRPR
jgi:hypothetical protein